MSICHWCGHEDCEDSEACAASLAWELSVLCDRCGEPSGIHPMTVHANGGTTVVCAVCALATNPVDP